MEFKFKKILEIYDDESFFSDDGAGVYCWKLASNSKLVFEYPENNDLNHDFTNENKVIYIGKAEKKYKVSERFSDHLKIQGKTTLRLALGGVLNFINNCIPNDSYGSYYFDIKSEEEITNWMENNLEFGYILYNGDAILKSYETLKIYEDSIIIKYQPSLNSDKWDQNRLHYYNIRDIRRWCKEAT